MRYDFNHAKTRELHSSEVVKKQDWEQKKGVESSRFATGGTFNRAWGHRTTWSDPTDVFGVFQLHWGAFCW